ncbi:SPOR domain-containing protein [bacterium SCSIO 12741]|nr:SPOR domain-containing protein [bacterium SCSIO 12741]
MEGIFRHIEQLLFSHDCVIVPGFGGFVGNPHSARLDRLRSRILPPYKEIGFNSRLTKSDGLLAHTIAEEQQIPFAEAQKQLNAFVQDIRQELRSKGKIVFPKIGTFYYDHNRSLRFKPLNTVNFAPGLFGLEPVQLIPLAKPVETPVVELAAEAKEEPKESTPIIDIREYRKRLKNWKTAAVVVACVPLLFYLIWLPTGSMVFKDKNFQLSELNPFSPQVCAMYTARTGLPEVVDADDIARPDAFEKWVLSGKDYVKTSFFDRNDPYFDPTELITIKVRELALRPDSLRVKSLLPPTSYQGYYAIGGCFRERDNATRLVARLQQQGFGAVIIDQHKGLYRVGIEQYTTLNEAKGDLDRIRSAGFGDAWILKK